MNDLEKIKERIRSEQQYGDVAKACENAGYSTSTYNTAMKRNSLSELKDGELKVLKEMINLLDERIASRKKLAEYAK